jgi:PhoH-like ATPase
MLAVESSSSEPFPLKKNFVLDTNVLLHDSNALFKFDDNDVCVPIYVIEEIDGFKKQLNELGRNARAVSRTIDEYRCNGNLKDGVPMPTGGRLRVPFAENRLSKEFSVGHEMDSAILAVAIELIEKEPDRKTIFVTMDVNLRIRANALGVQAESYEAAGKVQVDELYQGFSEATVEPSVIERLGSQGSVEPPADLSPNANQYLMLRNAARERETMLGRYDAREGVLRPLAGFRDGVFGVRPRNREQYFALDALLVPEVQLVTLAGKAGTGKTLLACAAGLEQVMERDAYTKLLISRPIFPLGRDIGFLPGDVEEKLNPWMQPIWDNLELLMGLTQRDRKNGRGAHELEMLGVLQVEPLTYIRGRSIPQQFMIVDEAQNLTPHEVKTILTRVGEGTKIIFTGDIYQIDNPYVDAVSNGLSYLAEAFKGQPIHAHVSLVKGERSELAELASNLL